jgi:hypothetical protein
MEVVGIWKRNRVPLPEKNNSPLPAEMTESITTLMAGKGGGGDGLISLDQHSRGYVYDPCSYGSQFCSENGLFLLIQINPRPFSTGDYYAVRQ